MMDEAELILKVEQLKKMIPENEWKFYSLYGIENFIFHLKSFENLRSRDNAVNDINKYLDLVFEKLHEESTRREKIGALLPHFLKILRLYRLEVGFVEKPNIVYFFVILIVSFVILNTALSQLTSIILALSISLSYLLYGYTKVKSKKVY